MYVFCADFVHTATMGGLPTSGEDVKTYTTQHTPLPHEGISLSAKPGEENGLDEAIVGERRGKKTEGVGEHRQRN